jgi:hypothetical protein
MSQADSGSGGFTFSADVDFLGNHTDVLVLSGDTPAARVAVAPKYQGRVMTSTLAGPSGTSFGWINRKFVTAGKTGTEFDNYGGEDRLWFGPEAGPFGLFFKPGDKQTPDVWFTPPAFNDFHFDAVNRQGNRVRMTKRGMTLSNVAGTSFTLDVEREITVLSGEELNAAIHMPVPDGVRYVAYQSRNVMRNAGPDTWRRDGGLPSIWILGQYAPAPKGVAIVPYVAGDESKLGPVANGNYFDPVPPDRLKVTPKTVLFKTDGQQRGKIGVGPKRCRSSVGSYDAGGDNLTVVQLSFTHQRWYVSSLWETPQKAPFGGDVINCYNDGPLRPGEPPLHGGFYELETSSHADELQVHQEIEHVHRTIHFHGPRAALQPLAAKTLNADLDAVCAAFGL